MPGERTCRRCHAVARPKQDSQPARVCPLTRSLCANAAPASRCQVDATQFEGGAAEPACCSVALLADQVHIAQALVGSKADLCSDAALWGFQRWAQGLFPPKQLVATARRGQLEPAVVQALLGGSASPASPGEQGLGAHRALGTPWLSSSPAGADEEAPARERPLRRQVLNAEGTHAACG